MIIFIRQKIIHFFQWEAFSGILLIIATLLALLLSNTGLNTVYHDFLNIPISIGIQDSLLKKPLVLWINDGLMVLFFLLIGLEVKREMLEGHLAKLSSVLLPAVAAIGGMLVPALIYTLFNYQDPHANKGWAIPMATDIAFSLGVLALLGKKIPSSIKLFLMTLAIIDDLGAIIVIALFYSGHLSFLPLLLAGACLAVLVLMNRLKINSLGLYLMMGILLWLCILNSGIHATIAGVLLAFTIPLRTQVHNKATSPLLRLEHALHPYVTFLILPLFALANAGVSFTSLSYAHLFSSVTIGIVLGLLVGKTIGVFGFTWLAVYFRLAKLPQSSSWPLLLGVALLCGIGFTMSLFIGSLSFSVNNEFFGVDRIGILLGSLFSAVAGYIVIRLAVK